MTSFPFLKIARDHGVDYSTVIRLAEECWNAPEPGLVVYNPILNAVWDTVLDEQDRRVMATTLIVSEAHRIDDEAAP
jgi:hypothetical protein